MISNDQTASIDSPLFLSFSANCNRISLWNKQFWDSNILPPGTKIELQKMENTCLGILIYGLELHWCSVIAYLKYRLKVEFFSFPHTIMWLGRKGKIGKRRIRFGVIVILKVYNFCGHLCLEILSIWDRPKAKEEGSIRWSTKSPFVLPAILSLVIMGNRS